MYLPDRLIALSPGSLRDSRCFPAFLNALEGALGAGLPGVLLREPQLGTSDFLRLSEEVQERCSPNSTSNEDHKTWFGVHDSVHVALRLGADGVHLGFKSLPPWEVRDLVGDAMAIGFSSHAGDGPDDWRGADYLFHGPVHATPSKDGVLEPIGNERFDDFCASANLPVFALGGIGPNQVAGVASQGAGVAAMRGILGAADSASATQAYLQALADCPPSGAA